MSKIQILIILLTVAIIPVGILTFFFPTLDRVFGLMVFVIVIYTIYDQQERLKEAQNKIYQLKNKLAGYEK